MFYNIPYWVFCVVVNNNLSVFCNAVSVFAAGRNNVGKLYFYSKRLADISYITLVCRKFFCADIVCDYLAYNVILYGLMGRVDFSSNADGGFRFWLKTNLTPLNLN
jgi:hypothetical protein